MTALYLLYTSSSFAGFWDIFTPEEDDLRETVNICYFSLNNDEEYDVTDDFVSDLNISKEYNIKVTEFHGSGDRPSESFRDMIKSGVKCDGLVISDHHTSSFGGERASGQLSVDYMEGL